MICDNEQDVLLSFELILKSKYDLIMANSGEDCIEKYLEEKNRGNKIHLILLDYKMDDMMGDSVARRIKEFNGTKIILISAYNIDDDRIRKRGYISKYILKPTETDTLTDLIDEL